MLFGGDDIKGKDAGHHVVKVEGWAADFWVGDCPVKFCNARPMYEGGFLREERCQNV